MTKIERYLTGLNKAEGSIVYADKYQKTLDGLNEYFSQREQIAPLLMMAAMTAIPFLMYFTWVAHKELLADTLIVMIALLVSAGIAAAKNPTLKAVRAKYITKEWEQNTGLGYEDDGFINSVNWTQMILEDEGDNLLKRFKGKDTDYQRKFLRRISYI